MNVRQMLPRFGRMRLTLLCVVATDGLSMAVTAVGLSVFQGYIDALGMAIAVIAPSLILPLPLYLFFGTILKLDGAETLLRQKNLALENALQEVKKLSGLLPICAHCKKIRDDRGYWENVEVYIRQHAEVTFSHSICPECGEMHYAKYKKRSAKGSRTG